MTTRPPDLPSGGWNVDPARIDHNWRAITIELDAPRPGRMERLLRAVGLPTSVTRVVVATPALRRAWFLAMAFAMFIGLIPLDGQATATDLFTLLLVAPLVPVLGVSLAYGVESDPAHEISLAAPVRGLRLIVTRAAVVLTVSTLMLGLVALVGSGISPLAFAWMLPSVGLTSLAVALMTYVPPRRAAAIVAVVWVVGVALVGMAAHRLAAFGPAGQAVAVSLALGAGLVARWRRDEFDLLEVQL